MKKSFKFSFKKSRCGRIAALKGIAQPVCSCNRCWDFYFRANTGKTLAGALAITKLGEQAVIKGQGTEYFEQMKPWFRAQINNGTRLAMDIPTIIENRGEKYLKHLKRYIKENNIDSTLAEEAVAQAA